MIKSGGMMANFMVAVIGKDKPGIIAGISKVIYENGMNIEDGSSTILAGEFSTILVVSGNISQNNLRESFKGVSEALDLYIAIHQIEGARTVKEDKEHALITVYSADRPGILYGVSTPLAEYGINIINLDTRLVGSEDNPAYIASFEVELPEHYTFDMLEKLMAKIKTEQNLNISAKQLNGTAL
ncbi:MAG: ACT domain-containing protein [Epsilonproteobacteria bacterium]|nr:ACT domain-containing protein [Campylobacterota bacterium]